jgi:hypothetical protein
MGIQAIVTKFLGPTNFRGSRVKATASAGSVTIEWDHALNPDGNHRAAAEALCRKLGWSGRYVEGGQPEGNGNVYVCDIGDGFGEGRFEHKPR